METRFLPDSAMLEILAKVQPLQAEILKTGRSCHLDAGIHNNLWAGSGTHINFDVTIFEQHEIVRQFEFSANMSQEELTVELAAIQAYLNRIKDES